MGGGYPCCCREQVPECADRLFGAPDAESIPTSLDIVSSHATTWNNSGGGTEYSNDVSGCGTAFSVDGTGIPGSQAINGSGADCGTLQATGCGMSYGYGTTEENLCGYIATVDPPPSDPGDWDVDFQFSVVLAVDVDGTIGTAGHVWLWVSRSVQMLFSPSGNAGLISCGLKDLGPYDDFDITALNETVTMLYNDVGGATTLSVGDPAGDVVVSAP
jgi:hypothetical protein